jgi:hypothetical protein
LQAFCRKEFFEPLDMTSTQWRDDFRRIVLNRAIAYAKRGAEWRQDMPFEDIYGNGGLLTSVGDLLKWNRNMAGGKLHASVFEQMQKPGALNDGRPIRYGFGLFLEDFEGFPEVSHSGATAGYRTWLGRIPSKGLSIAVVCNAASANATAYAHQLADLYLGGPKPNAPLRPESAKPGLYRSVRDRATIQVGNGRPLPTGARFEGDKLIVPNATYGEDVWERVEPSTPADLNAFTGVYTSDEAETVLRVVVENKSLVIRRRPASSFTLKTTYLDAFECPLGSVQFLRDETGKIGALSLGGSRVWDLRFARQDSGKPGVPR